MAAVVTLGSCSNDTELDNNRVKNEKEIGFRSLIDKGSNTRVTVATGNNILGFTLTGWWDRTDKISSVGGLAPGDGTDATVADAVTNAIASADANEYLFNAVDITRRETGITDWTYAPKRYWPADDIIGGGVAFFAYSPASTKSVTQGLHGYTGGVLEYTVPNPDRVEARENAQEDFLLARTNPKNPDGSAKNSGDVALNFVHALSRVRFFARTTNTNLTYIIGGVEMMNLAMTGEIDMKKIPADGSITYDDFSSSSTPVTLWGNIGNSKNIGIDMGESPINLLGIGSDASKYYSLHGESAALMVLPQTTELGAIDKDDPSNNTGFLIKVSYKAYLNNPNTDTYFAGGKDYYEDVYFQVIDNQRSEGAISTPFTFELGRQYNFCLEFGSEAGKEITFDVNVGAWNNADPVSL